MNSIREVKPGDLLWFTPEDLTIMVVMTGDDGIRYIEPTNLNYDNNGHIETKYATYETFSEWTVVLCNVDEVKTTMGK